MDSAKEDWKRKRTPVETRTVRIIPPRSVGPTGKEFRRQQFLSVVPCGSGKQSSRKTDGQIKFFSRRKASTRSISLRRDIFVASYCRIRDLLKAVYRYPRHGCPSKWFRGYIWCGPARRNLSRETSKSRCNFMEASPRNEASRTVDFEDRRRENWILISLYLARELCEVFLSDQFSLIKK